MNESPAPGTETGFSDHPDNSAEVGFDYGPGGSLHEHLKGEAREDARKTGDPDPSHRGGGGLPKGPRGGRAGENAWYSGNNDRLRSANRNR